MPLFLTSFVGFEQGDQVRHFPQPIRYANGHGGRATQGAGGFHDVARVATDQIRSHSDAQVIASFAEVVVLSSRG
jgi:hypothetical protein